MRPLLPVTRSRFMRSRAAASHPELAAQQPMLLEIVMRLVEVIAGGGVAAPVEQRVQALLPADARREAERLARTRDVGGAVTHVAASKLAGHARREVLATRQSRERAADVADAAQLAASEVHDDAVRP